MKNMPAVSFDSKVIKVRGQNIVRLPEVASKRLPSRGQIAAAGTINGQEFKTVLEPDGDLGHWMRIDAQLQKEAGISPSDTVTLEIEPIKEWPEPKVPSDFAKALAAAPAKVKAKWHDITPMARWEWVRWVNSTGNLDTRAGRIEKSISKLNGKHRRPCCFNLAACTDPKLCKSGRLLEPAQKTKSL